MYYLLLLIIIALFVLVHSFLSPFLFLRPTKKDCIKDVAVDDKITDGVRSIVYLPAARYRKYIRHYALTEQNGIKCVVCEPDKNVNTLDYNIVMYNKKGVAFRTLRVKDDIARKGYTSEVELHKKTAYISVTINETDEEVFPLERQNRVGKGGIAKHLVFCAVVDLVCVFAIRFCIAELFNEMFVESFSLSIRQNVISLVLWAVVVLFNVVVTILLAERYRYNYRGNKKGGRANGKL